MLLTLEFDRGNGIERRKIGPGAQVGWEIRTKRRVSDLGDGVGVQDMVVMLMEQLRQEGEDVGTDARRFANSLSDINPVADVVDEQDPTPA